MTNTHTLIITILTFISTLSFGQSFNSLALHSQVDHVQPMTGIVFWAANTGDLNTLGDKVQLEFSYLIYSDIIDQEGQYDWSDVDDLLETTANRGRQVVLRFRYTYPGQTKRSVPLYITERSDYTTHYENIEGSNTFIPDWTNGTLEDFTLEFYTKFAERYDNDPRLAFIQVGFGSYAEYHLWSGPSNPVGTYFPSKTYQTEFLTHMASEFSDTPWTISIDAASSSYTPFSSNSSLKNLKFGLFDDSFLHSSHSANDNEYNRSNWLSFGADRADENVAGGELNYYSQWDQEHVLDEEGPYDFTYEELSEMYDITYMIGNDQLNYQSAARIEEAGMANGYHFEVIKFETDGSTTHVTIKNTGIAPIYYDAFPSVNGVQSTESLKGLIADESKEFIINTAANNEQLEIYCERLVSGQEIQFDADIEADPITNVENFVDVQSVIYPNPTTGLVHLPEDSNYEILDMSGKIIQTGIGSTVNLSNQLKGIYFINIETSIQSAQFKLIKE